jgi:hypothetical protein
VITNTFDTAPILTDGPAHAPLRFERIGNRIATGVTPRARGTGAHLPARHLAVAVWRFTWHRNSAIAPEDGRSVLKNARLGEFWTASVQNAPRRDPERP